MDTRTHISLGVTTTVTFSLGALHWNWGDFTTPKMFLLVSFSALGSILPDADHPEAFLSKRLPLFAKFLCWYYSVGGKYFGDYKYQYALKMHRGICHSFSACIMAFISICPLLFFSIERWAVTGLLWGMLLHLFADTLTPMGCMLLAPFSTKRFTCHISKNGKSEKIIRFSHPWRYALLYIFNLIIGSCIWLNMLSVLLLLSLSLEYKGPRKIKWKSGNFDIYMICAIFVFLLFQLLLRFARKKVGLSLSVSIKSSETSDLPSPLPDTPLDTAYSNVSSASSGEIHTEVTENIIVFPSNRS